jgi:transcriptional regulator with XRE-family HTH domain
MDTPSEKPLIQRRTVLQMLGARVRHRRRECGLSQTALAQSLDLSTAYISLIERGGRNPPITTVFDIAHALGVAPRDLAIDRMASQLLGWPTAF